MASAFRAPADRDVLLDYDRRNDAAAAARRAQPIAKARLDAELVLRNRVPDVQIERHAIHGSPKWIAAREGSLTGANGQGKGMAGAVAKRVLAPNDPHRVIKAFVDEHAGLFGHDATALEGARLKRDATTRHNGLRTVVWEQEHEGIRVFDAVFIANVTKNEELVNVASQFVPNPPQAALKGTPKRIAGAAPLISSPRAIALAAAHLGEEAALESELTASAASEGANRRQKFRAPWIKGETRAELVWLPLDGESLRLCWEVSLKGRVRREVYRVLIDAETGEVWERHCMTVYISDASYRVFTSDSPTPLTPSYSSTGNASQPGTVSRALVTTKASNTNASPLGWITDGVNETRGNNASAATDLGGDDSPEARPQGSPNRVFDFALNLGLAPTDSNYRKAAVVNLFYWGNWLHDRLWELGFDEGFGNYQDNNFGRGGSGSDGLRLDAQDGEGVKNANFNTTAYGDGNDSWIQMYIFPDPSPDRDGDFDNQVIIHEYLHGVSLRLVGGGVGMTASQSKGMGEGWGDFFALAMLSQSGDAANGTYAKGSYATKNLEFDGKVFAANGDNYYFGIRRYPYSTDMSKNPLTFKDIDGNQDSAHAGVAVSPLFGGTTASEVHNQGEVWCSLLWEARAKMIAKHGFSTGNQLIQQLVIDGMKMSAPNPNFVQSRDAILQADQVNNGGANLKELWAAFAKRGLGFSATSPGSSTTSGVVEDFAVPDTLLVTPLGQTTVTGPQGGPFPSTSKTYLLLNSSGSSMGWSAAAEFPMTVSLASGTLAANGSVNVTASLNQSGANLLPAGIHIREVTFSNKVTHVVQTRVFKINVINGLAIDSPNDNNFEGPVAGEFLPTFKTVTLTNLKNISMPYSAIATTPLRALPSSGTLAPGEIKDVLVIVYPYDTPGLGLGLIEAPVQFSNHLDHSVQAVTFDITIEDGWYVFGGSSGSSAVGPVGGPFVPASAVIELKNRSYLPTAWSAVAQAPLKLSQDSGVLQDEDSETDITVYMNTAQAAFMFQGTYAPTVIVSNHLTGTRKTNTFTLRIGEGDTFTENFGSFDGDFDLDYTMLTFTPDGSGNYYRLCRDSASSFPTSPSGGTPVTGYAQTNVVLSSGKKINFYGQQFSQFTIDRNHGYVAFGSDTYGFHENRLGISVFDSYALGSEGSVSWKQTADRMAVTWNAVPNDYDSGTTSGQLEMFFDGRIRLTYLGVDLTDGTVGLSRGLDEERETNLSAYPDCDDLYAVPKEALKVTMPPFATEGDGPLGSVGRVMLPFKVPVPVTVGLRISTNSAISVPSSITFAANQTNRTFNITVLDDALLQGPRIAVVWATNADFYNGSAQMTIQDNESTTLSVSLPPSVTEGGTNVVGKVFSAAPPVIPVKVYLYATQPDQLAPVSVLTTLGAGQTQAFFSVKAIDDTILDGPQTGGVIATVSNWVAGTDSMLALDNESTNLNLSTLIITIEGFGTLTNGGTIKTSGTLLTNLTVFLQSDDTSELTVPPSVVIPAGTNAAKFNIDVVDDVIQDGGVAVTIRASAPGFGPDSFDMLVLDNDGPPEVFDPFPPDDATNVPVNTHLGWGRVEGELIVNGNFETGDLTGWTMEGSDNGGFVVNNGTFDPASPDGPLPPFAGNFSALAHQLGNGTHALYQDIFIPDAATSTTLRWTDRIRNHASGFAANHQFRVELRDPDNQVRTVLFRTQPGDPNFSEWTERTFDLSDYRGETLRVAFVEQDALGHLNVHLDGISVHSASANPTTFDVYFGTDSIPDTNEYVGSTTNTTWPLPQLAGGINYYWKIVARRGGATNDGPVWHFTTAGQSFFSLAFDFESAWRYVATGVDLGTAWRSRTYVDTLWPLGTASFGFGSSENTTIGVASNGFTTFYFRRRMTLLDTNRLVSALVYLKCDDGAVVYVNGTEMFRDNMPTGTVTHLTQASTIITGSDETNATAYTISGAPFIEGTNVIAVEVHQRHSGFPTFSPSPDLFFDFALLIRTNAGNLMPERVNWQQPPNFTQVRTPTNLVLQASAVDDNLFGARLEFYADGEKIGEDTFTPFFLTWTNPPVGQHVLTAVVIDPGGLTATSAPLHIVVAPASGTALIALVQPGSTWRYQDNGIYPGSNWTALNYREPAGQRWKSGPAQLGYGDGDEATVVDFGRDYLDKHITTWFRQTFNNTFGLTTGTLRVLRDDGVVVYLNGIEVYRNNLPAGAINANTLATATVVGADENKWLTRNLLPGALQPGLNVIAAEIHQSSASGVDISFDLELTGTVNPRPTVALTSPSTFAHFFMPPSITFQALASDTYGQVTSVNFYNNGVFLGADATGPHEFTWNNPPAGIHTITARARDSGGIVATSAPVQITVLAPASLKIESMGALSELVWSATAPGYSVETASNLAPPVVWRLLTNPVIETNGSFRMAIDPAQSDQYFRLRAP